MPRVAGADDLPGADAVETLRELVRRLDPAPPIVRWPRWVGSNRDETVLMLGVSQGKPDRRVVVDIPDDVAGLVVPVSTGVLTADGLARCRHPAWVGDPLTSDGRLAALVEIVRAAGESAGMGDVKTQVSWCVGGGRADCGSWSRSQGLPEASGWSQRRATSALGALDVPNVLAAVLDAAGAGD